MEASLQNLDSTYATLISSFAPTFRQLQQRGREDPILRPSTTNDPDSAKLLLTHLPESSTASETHDVTPNLSAHLTAISAHLNASSLSSRYFGFVTGGVTPAALLADLHVSTMDQNVAVHLPKETIATEVEVRALNMLHDLFALPREDSKGWGVGGECSGYGSFTTGATASNVIGLALGREYVLSRWAQHHSGKCVSVGEAGIAGAMAAGGITRVKILSTLPHSSIGKAASIVGLGRACVVDIRTQHNPLDIDMAKLEAELAAPGEASIVCVSTGEVNTGHFGTRSGEQFLQLRHLCDRYHAWIHVDGAFGLFARLLLHNPADRDAYAHLTEGVKGVELADSITGDAHKLLNVPYDCGFYFTRHKELCGDVFRNAGAAYLSTGAGDDDGILSPLNVGIENSRRFRALPVYATLYAYGRSGYVGMLKRQIELARRVAGWVWDHPGMYTLLPVGQEERAGGGEGGAVVINGTTQIAQPRSSLSNSRQSMLDQSFMIVLFRAADRFTHCHADRLVQRINATGKMYVSGTAWDGRKAARIAVSNWQSSVERDWEVVMGVLEEVGGCDEHCPKGERGG